MAEELLSDEEGQGRVWSHVFVEWEQMDPLCQPVSSSSRIKYQCIAVSKRYIALGTNTGAIYIFQRDSLQYLDMITTDKEGSIVQVAFSPDDNVFSYATSKGHAVILELRFEKRQKPERLRHTGDHKGSTVTAMKWNAFGNRLYIGDDSGKVSVAKISSTLVKKNDFFALPSELIMRLDSSVGQIDCYEDKVLASTLTKTYLCFTSKQKFKHIGTKLRDGVYGASFFHKSTSEPCAIYCARPGSRLWEVDAGGNVLRTHQFKLLFDIPSLPVVKTWPEKLDYPTKLDVGGGPVSTNFIQLLNSGGHLVSWNEKALFVLDPTEAQVLLWNNKISDIQKVVIFKQEIFLLFDNNRIQRLELMPIAKLVSKLFHLHSYTLCAKIAIAFHSTLVKPNCRRHVPVSMIADLKQQLESENDIELSNQLDNLLQNAKSLPEGETTNSDSVSQGSKASFDKLESGIYVLRQRTESETSANIEVRAIDGQGDKKIKGDDLIMENEKDMKGCDEIPAIKLTETKDEPKQTQAKVVKDQDEDSVSRESSSLSRHQSSESLVSLNSVLSNELVFGTPTLDPEPVYVQTKAIRKLKGRKAKVTCIDLDGKLQASGERKIKRSQSTSVLDRRSPRPSRKHSTVSADVTFVKPDESSLDDNSELIQTSETPKGCKEVEKTPVRKTQSCTDRSQTIADREISTPTISSFIVPASSTVKKVKPKSSRQSSLESSIEDENRKQGSPAVSSSTPDSSHGSPRFGGLRAVKDRISAKMETVGSSVGLKTKSLFQSLRDKTEQLKSKRSEYVEPADVAENKETGAVRLDESDSSLLSLNDTQNLPRVDISKLEDATKQAKEQLDDLDVKFNPKAATRVLNQWIECLNETLQNLHTAVLEQKIEELREYKLLNKIIEENTLLKKSEAKDVEKINTEPETGENVQDEGILVEAQIKDNSDKRGEDMTDRKEQTDYKDISVAERKELDQEFSNEADDVDSKVEHVEIDSSEISAIGDLIESTVHLADPYQMTSEIHGDMAKLALLCFQYNVHGNPSKYIRPKEKQIDDGADLDLDVLDDTKDDIDHKGCGDMEENNNVSIPDEDDKELGQMSKCHFHFFRDSIRELVKVIERSAPPKDYRWNAFIQCLAELSREDSVSKHIHEGNIEVAYDVLRSGPVQERQCLWSHLKRLFCLYPKRTLEFCCELSKEVSLEFVQYLCANSEDPLQYFLHYTKQVLMTAPLYTRKEILVDLCCNEEARMSLIEALLKEGTMKPEGDTDLNLHCTCGQPRPGSHKAQWKEKEHLDTVLSVKESHTDKILQMCQIYGYWWGYLKLLKSMKREEELMRTALQLCDVDLLQDTQYGFQPGDIQQWEKIFALKKEQHCSNPANSSDIADTHSVYCICCKTEISDLGELSLTYENLAVCVVKYVGPATTLDLLRKIGLPEGQLSFGFYQSCVLAASLESQQRMLVHNILEKLDTYLWSVKPNTIPSQIQGAIECERKHQGDSVKDSLFAKLSGEGAIKRSVEEQEVHWGTVANLQSFCLACFLSLQDQITSDDKGVVIFKCGHAFHKRCFYGRTCVVCRS